MLDKDTVIKVTNFSRSTVSYVIPEMNISRFFTKNETKEVTMAELRALSYQAGGKGLMKDYLRVDSEDVLAEFNISVEPEYFWTEEDVKDLLLNGSLERLQDCLDYAPQGIIDLVKDTAIKLELNDMSKREAISKATHFNITKAIEINKLDREGQEEQVEADKPKRRVPINKD